MSADLATLALGSLTLSPAFSADTTAYTASTSNATNTLRYTLVDDDATAEVKLNGTAATSNAMTWVDGENTVTIKVTSRGQSKTYTLTVTKT